MPALALLTGWLCDRLLAEGAVSPLRRTFLLAQAALVAIAVAGAVYVFFLAPPDVAAGIGLTLGHLRGVAVLGLLVAGAGLVALRARRDRLGLAAIAAFLPAVLFYFLLFLAPAINPYRTMKGLTRAMDSFMSPGQDIVFYKRTKDTALFYSDRTVRELEQPEDVAAYLAADERVFLFVDQKKVDELERLGLGAHVVGREGEVDVYSNRPGALDLP
jgi:hypothetical protein